MDDLRESALRRLRKIGRGSGRPIPVPMPASFRWGLRGAVSASRGEPSALVAAPLRDQASQLRVLAQLTGMPIFDAPGFTAQPEIAGELAAMSVKHLGALGCYRAPGASADVYLAIMSVNVADRQ